VAPAGATAPEATPNVITYVASGKAKIVDHRAMPLRLLIPRLGVDASVVAVGLTADGAMDVPQRSEDVGWYEYSPRPGLKGNAVLAGHLDWNGAPAVFWTLADLKQGDSVVVRGADGQERVYGVDWRKDFSVANAPIPQIFEPLDVPALTLITCGGRWNAAARRYDARVVVRARRA
jgi:sortase (surface protein transpeptidase)